MSKTFREVIRDIKSNETYKYEEDEENTMEIRCNKDNVITISTFFSCIQIKPSYDFEKAREKVSFDVAFKEYLKGKEIESISTGNKYKIVNYYYSIKTSNNNDWNTNSNMLVNEIKNDWYIND